MQESTISQQGPSTIVVTSPPTITTDRTIITREAQSPLLVRREIPDYLITPESISIMIPRPEEISRKTPTIIKTTPTVSGRMVPTSSIPQTSTQPVSRRAPITTTTVSSRTNVINTPPVTRISTGAVRRM